MGRPAPRGPVRAVAVALLCTVARAQCDFLNQIDPYTMYNNLNGDYSAYTSDDCKANCCNVSSHRKHRAPSPASH